MKRQVALEHYGELSITHDGGPFPQLEVEELGIGVVASTCLTLRELRSVIEALEDVEWDLKTNQGWLP